MSQPKNATECTVCSQFITCHGAGYRYISCHTCSPSEENICFDCYRSGNRCSTPDHELCLVIYDAETGEQFTQPLSQERDSLVLEAGCSETVDPLLAFVDPESLPPDWFKCIYFAASSSQADPLECDLRVEQYRPSTSPRDMAVMHPPGPVAGGVKRAVRCNGELVEVSEGLNDLLRVAQRLPFDRYWIADFCLAESLRSSPPIPLKAINALAGRLTNNHVFIEPGVPRSDAPSVSSSVKLLRLVKFDRFGTPVLRCDEVESSAEPTFHVRTLSRERPAGTVFVNGLIRKVSRNLVNFFRTCDCRAHRIKVPDMYGGMVYGRKDVLQRATSPTCTIHGDARFFIPQLCLDIVNVGESAIAGWIEEHAASNTGLITGRKNAYAPLQETEIRLLRFFPARLGAKGNVDVPMATITHRLDTTPKFVALSYCWGSSTRDCLLPMLTREILEITQHLGQILRDLIMSGATDVWIDQICIDQDNLEEKATQVAQMLQIYKAADEVLIHLGQLSAPEKVVHFVKHIAPRCLQQGVSSVDFPARLSPEDLDCWFAFREARSSPWFSRTWIIQEMSVNLKTSVLLGVERVPWDDFLVADTLTDEVFLSDMPPDLIGMHSMRVFAGIRKHQQDKGSYDAVSLFEILDTTRFLQASEPKDKVYAFMGLFDQTSVGKWLPYPSYRRQVADVYTSFAFAYALNGYTLHLLPLAGTSQSFRDHQTSMPSWVPDWRFGNVLLRSLRDNRTFEHGEDSFASGTKFSASAAPKEIPAENHTAAATYTPASDLSKRRIPLGDFSNRERDRDPGMNMVDHALLPMINSIKASGDGKNASIVVKLALFDEIVGLTKLRLYEEVLQPQMAGLELQAPIAALLDISNEASRLVSTHIAASDDTAYRLAKTMIADTWKEKDHNDIARIRDEWLQRLQNTREGRPSGEPTDGPAMPRYAGRVRQTFHNRVFGVTKQGRMGIFPSTTQVGDQVGIVAGLDLPYVFSQRTQNFALVGEAYIEDVMYGEFEETESAKFQYLEVV